MLKELYKQKSKWNDELKGIVTAVTNVKVLNGARALIKDDSPFLHYQVRYDISFLKPEVGQKVKAKVAKVQKGHITLTAEDQLTILVEAKNVN